MVATILEGIVRYQKRPDGKSEYIEFRDQNGELIATHCKHGWKMYETKAESVRLTEFRLIYMDAWKRAKKGVPITEETQYREYLQSKFDKKA